MIVEYDEGEHGLATASFSDDRRYRYSLTRRWRTGGELMLWIMLNPSTADAFKLDPTVRRCVEFARREDFAGIVVVNLYALRATRPTKLLLVEDPIGHVVNKATIIGRLQSVEVGLVVAAWGAWWTNLHSNAKIPRLNVEGFARDAGRDLYRLGALSKGGAPRHPLYVHHDDPLVPYDGGELLIGGTS